MSIEITYWTARPDARNVVSAAISSESLTISGTSARTTAATPDSANFVSIVATENARFDYSGPSSTASASSAYIASGERLWLTAAALYKVAGITA